MLRVSGRELIQILKKQYGKPIRAGEKEWASVQAWLDGGPDELIGWMPIRPSTIRTIMADMQLTGK